MPRIPLALLADHALAHTDDLKLYVLGGGIRSLSFHAFPANVPRLALALGLEFSADELGADPHNLRIEASGPGPEPPLKPFAARVSVPRNMAHPDQPVYFHFVINLENISLPTDGDFLFSVMVDEQLAAEVPLRVQKIAGPVPVELEPQILLNEGFKQFAAGDQAGAEAIFRDVTKRYPAEASAHNNLGFLLLGKGQAKPALEAFQKARELGYIHPELLDANIGCCHYLLGELVAAQIFFEQCLRIHGFRSPSAVLFAIDTAGLSPVALHSAADYVSLAMLNAAWSASTSDRVTAERYLEGATAAELGRREDEDGRIFTRSLQSLRDFLRS